MKHRTLLLALLTVPLLLGCVKEPAAFLIQGGDHSLTIERNKPYFWSDGWELDLITARYPDCQRRHPLKKAAERMRIDLYRVEQGVFILNQGKRWYITETRDCRMQQFDEEPPEAGEFIGSFREKNEAFLFEPYVEEAKTGKNSKAAKK
ncbi:MAG: hypothetical protein Q8M20_08970 [Rhodocyclaceae bacterium]|nr:hypothetical protein [Rhodocyclaceae bacterium]MDZ4215451.1 hypothetical protein [Rhodocyclaceae bacterium]